MKKYVQVGCGIRGAGAFGVPLVKEFGDCGVLLGVYDTNRKRAKLLGKLAECDVPVYDDFEAMLEDAKPDTVIITTRDCDHDRYAIAAMHAGCDVIVEKPLTTTFEKAVAIRKVQVETGREVIVTFNLRFHPFFKRIKEILSSGVLGKIVSVHYEWMLDTDHGADYFRRWHRERKNSGSLLVHKSTHHFDLINWYLEEDPVAVNAFGARRFYGTTRKERGKRCLTCPHKTTCEFFMDIHGEHEEMYFKCEDVDGYLRDGCVFSEEIDIEDTVSVNVEYSGGAVMSYSLTAHSPYEGMRMVLNGTDGRMEITVYEKHSAGFSTKGSRSVKIYNRLGEVIDIMMPESEVKGHGGADDQIRERLFRNKNLPDPLHQMADTRAGLMSIGIGMAANISMAEGRRVMLSEFYDESI